MQWALQVPLQCLLADLQLAEGLAAGLHAIEQHAQGLRHAIGRQKEAAALAGLALQGGGVAAVELVLD